MSYRHNYRIKLRQIPWELEALGPRDTLDLTCRIERVVNVDLFLVRFEILGHIYRRGEYVNLEIPLVTETQYTDRGSGEVLRDRLSNEFCLAFIDHIDHLEEVQVVSWISCAFNKVLWSKRYAIAASANPRIVC